MNDQLFDDYATVFAQFTTPYQQQAYELIAPLLKGDVLDAGCGCAKLAAYIPDAERVASYLGVDYSPSMVSQGKRLLDTMDQPNFAIRMQRIEDIVEVFDTIVSVQSYYSWSDPIAVLTHLYEHTIEGGNLILASANHRLDIELLIQNCSRGWSLHPDWPAYVDYNRKLASLSNGRFVSLDTMIGEVRQCGFEVLHTNVELFEQGVNMVVANKPECSVSLVA